MSSDRLQKSPVEEQEGYGIVKLCGKSCLICGKRGTSLWKYCGMYVENYDKR